MLRGIIKKLAVLFSLLFAALAIAVLNPAPLFAYSKDYGAFTVLSDRPIAPEMAHVIADAEHRLRSSELYRPEENYRVFVCNMPWRLLLLTRNGSVGGKTDTLFTRNIYIRKADVAGNRVLIDGVLADAQDRPLSYFIAHEAAHVLQSRRFGRFMSLRYPRWLIEGHADLVAKGGDFDLAQNRARMKHGDHLLSDWFAQRGLYRRYHLMVASLMERTGATAAQLFAAPPTEELALRAAVEH